MSRIRYGRCTSWASGVTATVRDRLRGDTYTIRSKYLTAADVDRAVDVALGAPYANPRPASADELRAVLHAAWAGESPYGG